MEKETLKALKKLILDCHEAGRDKSLADTAARALSELNMYLRMMVTEIEVAQAPESKKPSGMKGLAREKKGFLKLLHKDLSRSLTTESVGGLLTHFQIQTSPEALQALVDDMRAIL